MWLLYCWVLLSTTQDMGLLQSWELNPYEGDTTSLLQRFILINYRLLVAIDLKI